MIILRTWKELNAYKQHLTLTQEQREVIVGTVLGDLNIRKIGKCSRLVFEQKNKDYLFHLYDLFKDFTRTPPKERKQQRLATSEFKSTWYFSTISHVLFQEYYDLFYLTETRKKILPSSLNSLLTPRALAYWYMDDGGLQTKACTISTASFSFKEHLSLQSILYDNWGIKANVHGINTKNGYLSIYIPVEMSRLFVGLVEPYIVPTMKYKLPIYTLSL